MKKSFILLFIISICFSCALSQHDLYYWWDYDESRIPAEIQTKEDIVKFCFSEKYIQFEWDSVNYGKCDYFALPNETLRNNSGDCEDLAILALALFYKKLNKKGYLIIGIIDSSDINSVHAYIEVDGKSYNKNNVKYVWNKVYFDDLGYSISCKR